VQNRCEGRSPLFGCVGSTPTPEAQAVRFCSLTEIIGKGCGATPQRNRNILRQYCRVAGRGLTAGKTALLKINCMKYPIKVKNWIKKDGLSHLMLLALLGFVWLLPGAASGAPASARIPTDTIPKPKVYSVSYDLYKWQKKIDTLNMVKEFVGRSLTVDQSDQIKGFVDRILADVIRQINVQVVADTANKK
jgi:hypothetical protein